MPVVEETNHMGILRSSVSDEVSVTANMKKARRTLYSLMSSWEKRSRPGNLYTPISNLCCPRIVIWLGDSTS